ncbi:MAG: aminotransferase class V-fold PLP-dependent enzyme [Actinomycetota bacterium]
MTTFDVEFVRSQFPAFSHPDSADWAHLENAGGSYVPRQVIDRLHHFFTATKVQPYWDFAPSRAAGDAMDEAKRRLPATFNGEAGEVHFGPSTTQNTYVLSHAFRAGMSEGDEVIVTNQDHEANIGSWRRLAETGITVKEWQVDPMTGMLDPADLDALLSDRTALVAVTHASNLAATVNPIPEISAKAHAVGALVVVDGVSYAPHAAIDVQALGCDVYLYSAYKTFGPHVGMMWVAQSVLEGVANQGHYFNESSLGARLVPAGPDHAEIGASAGIMTYYDDVWAHHHDAPPADDVALVRGVFDLFTAHEEQLMRPLVDFVAASEDLSLVGTPSTSHADRAPTIAFHSAGRSSQEIYDALIAAKVSCGHGHFYAHRLVSALGLDPEDGVVRISMVHYNTAAEVERAIGVLQGLG